MINAIGHNDTATHTTTKVKNTTISDAYVEIGKLVFECWNRFHSFRLLAAVLRTQRYDTVYESMIRSKEFQGCKRSRPSRVVQNDISEISSDILAAMTARKITVRRWCQAHGVDLVDLWCQRHSDGSESTIVSLLREDFPEVFGLNPPEYKTAPIGCDRKHMFNPKKKCHIYWSNFFRIRVQHPKESDALKLYNWRKSQVVIIRRLRLLLDNGIDAALSYPPTEFLPLSDGNNRKSKQRMPVDPEEKAKQQEMHDMMRRDSEAKAMIRKLAMMSSLYCSDAQYAEKSEMQEKLTKIYCWTDEQIRNEVGRFRRKMASGK